MSLSKCLEQTARSWNNWFEALTHIFVCPLLFANKATAPELDVGAIQCEHKDEI